MLNGVVFCLVIAVADGDTLKARCGEPGAYERVTVRLAEIDAPEKGQAFGQRSKAGLSALCYAQWATIRPQTTDRYGRTVARVECRGTDASAEQARTGLAWFYVRYGTDPAVRDAEASARRSHAGLWIDSEPVEPWAWRQARRGRR